MRTVAPPTGPEPDPRRPSCMVCGAPLPTDIGRPVACRDCQYQAHLARMADGRAARDAWAGDRPVSGPLADARALAATWPGGTYCGAAVASTNLARALLRRDLANAVAFEVLAEWNSRANCPPLAESDLRRCLSTAADELAHGPRLALAGGAEDDAEGWA